MIDNKKNSNIKVYDVTNCVLDNMNGEKDCLAETGDFTQILSKADCDKNSGIFNNLLTKKNTSNLVSKKKKKEKKNVIEINECNNKTEKKNSQSNATKCNESKEPSIPINKKKLTKILCNIGKSLKEKCKKNSEKKRLS
ncbi:hypothetical protein GVAV_003347 [Gurleya vavrai]